MLLREGKKLAFLRWIMLSNYFQDRLSIAVADQSPLYYNILGLGLGIACCVLIVLFVRDEWTFDT